MPTGTNPAYSPGLEGVIAGESAICQVDPNAGLFYRGYDVHELARKSTFENVAYLMLYGELPNAQQLASFNQQLSSERPLPPQVLLMLKLLPKNTHPMDFMRTGVSMMGPFDPDLNDNSHDANVRKGVRLVAKLATLAAAGWRTIHGQEPAPIEPGL